MILNFDKLVIRLKPLQLFPYQIVGINDLVNFDTIDFKSIIENVS